MRPPVNERVYKKRKELGITQEELAEKLGMKPSTYAQMEREGQIKTQRLLDIAYILNIKPEELLFDSPNSNISSIASSPTHTFAQPTDLSSSVYNSPSIELKPKEERIIKILRNLSKSDYDEVISYINDKYKNSK